MVNWNKQSAFASYIQIFTIHRFNMYSPSAELDAYILNYKAQKSLEKTPYSTPTRKMFRTDSLSSGSWLHEVLTMPPELRERAKLSPVSSPQLNFRPNSPGDSSVTKWLNEIDEKISKRFPSVGNSNSKSNIEAHVKSDFDKTSDSDKTLELIMADPETGLVNSCHCASYDSHPNTSSNMKSPEGDQCTDERSVGDERYCDCSDLRASAWVDDVINENICKNCIDKENDSSNGYCPIPKEHSVDLPDGYKLFESGKSRQKTHKRSRSKKKNVSNNLKDKIQIPAQTVSPETENIMKLLERAIDQLQEVKGAVEDNTVSAITSDISCTTSQALSELPVD